MKTIPNEVLAIFCRELNQLYRSGISMSEGLAMLRDGEKDRSLKQALSDMYRYMTEEYDTLAAAMEKTKVFPPYMVDVLALAEQTGRLEDSLRSLSKHYDRQVQMANNLRAALTVPLTLFLVMVAVIILLITQVLPIFDRVFSQLGVKMGGVAVSMMQLGQTLSKAGTGILAAVVLLAAVIITTILVPSMRQKAAQWFLARFGDKGLFGQMQAARFASALSLGISSGLSIDEAVNMAARICGDSPSIQKHMLACKESLDKGKGTANALAASSLFPDRECRLVSLAEAAGTLPEVLSDMAERQEEASLRKIDRLVGAIEPSIVVLTSVMAGVILLSVMLPLMGLLGSMG